MKTSSRGASKTRVMTSSGSAGRARGARSRGHAGLPSSAELAQIVVEAVERAAPAALDAGRARSPTRTRPAASRSRVLPSRSVKSTRTTVSCLGLPSSSSQAQVKASRSGVHDLAEDAPHPVVGAFGRAHADAPRAALAHVHLAGRDLETARAPPAHQARGIGPGLEHEGTRRVEGARDDQLPSRGCRAGGGDRLPSLRVLQLRLLPGIRRSAPCSSSSRPRARRATRPTRSRCGAGSAWSWCPAPRRSRSPGSRRRACRRRPRWRR